MRALLRQWRCWLSGGHDLSGVLRFEDRLCRKCLHDCGYRTFGIPLGEKWERPAPKITRVRRRKARRNHVVPMSGTRKAS